MAGDRVRESGAHGQLRVCHMSDISLRHVDASASTPYRGSYMSLRNGEGDLVNRVMEVAMPRSTRRAFRHRFPSLSPASRVDFEIIWTMLHHVVRGTLQKPNLPEFIMPLNCSFGPHCSQMFVVGLGLCTTSRSTWQRALSCTPTPETSPESWYSSTGASII